MRDLSVLIPARNEMFLANTIDDILRNAEADTEVIAVADGYWPDLNIKEDQALTLIYLPKPIGQRAATNLAARVSTAKYVMKADAHCAFDKGFDVKLMTEFGADWTVVPRMYNLHAFDWECKACGNRTYQGPKPETCEKCGKPEGFKMTVVWQPRMRRLTEAWRFDSDLKFGYWRDYMKRPEVRGKDIIETMSLIGACFMMTRERYWQLDGMDENHGSWGQMGTEVACKTWLSGGRLVTNRRSWFGHMFRTQNNGFSFPYPVTGHDVSAAHQYSKKIWTVDLWPKAKHPVSWLVEKFKPVPGWHC